MKVNTSIIIIQIWFGLTRLRKDFSVCVRAWSTAFVFALSNSPHWVFLLSFPLSFFLPLNMSSHWAFCDTRQTECNKFVLRVFIFDAFPIKDMLYNIIKDIIVKGSIMQAPQFVPSSLRLLLWEANFFLSYAKIFSGTRKNTENSIEKSLYFFLSEILKFCWKATTVEKSLYILLGKFQYLLFRI